MAAADTAIAKARQVFSKHGGMLRTSKAMRLGIHPRTLYTLRDAGDIEQVGRGLYRLSTAPPLSSPDLVPIAIRIPRAVVCLVSALAHHGLTTQVPHAVDIALPSHAQVPKIDSVPLRVFWYPESSFRAGVDVITVDDVPMKIYSPEKRSPTASSTGTRLAWTLPSRRCALTANAHESRTGQVSQNSPKSIASRKSCDRTLRLYCEWTRYRRLRQATPVEQVAHARPPVSGTASVLRDGAFLVSARKIAILGPVRFEGCLVADRLARASIPAYYGHRPRSEQSDHVKEVVGELCEVDVEPDGIAFNRTSIEVSRIKEDADYEGVRVQFHATLARARITMQLDIGFGDVITPEPTDIEYPSLLDFPAPVLRAYPKETVVAEKLEALTALGLLNSRMKDFYDLALLSRMYPFEGERLVEAVSATFRHRATTIEAEPIGLTQAYCNDPAPAIQWRGFVHRSRFGEESGELVRLVTEIRQFALPMLSAIAAGNPFKARWKPGGPWE